MLEDIKLLTTDEACRVLRISRWKLYDLIRRGRIGTVRIGRRRFVPPEAIADLIGQSREGAI
ncbi:helix-turn-helix domain-containing protein [Streptosporangiaceae bacterium NEAU-GS5]|nr:helix-turn-helix domain-containing protein [Streptosporangiaceae bacterium NEAU-GS5]